MASRPQLSTQAIIRRVWIGQLLFSAGHSLTTGGFLNYFADPFFKGFALAFAVLQITPEASESLAVVTRWIVQRTRRPKTVWCSSLILARLVALAIPSLVLCGAAPGDSMVMAAIIVSLAVWYFLLGISYTSCLSWLSQRVPEVNWGKMLASRSIAISLVTIAMTGGASRLIDWCQRETGWDKGTLYPAVFTMGGVICLLSVVPLWSIPESEEALAASPTSEGNAEQNASQDRRESTRAAFGRAWQSISFRRFLLGSWQLAFFQGLTQTAQFQFSKNILKVSLSDYYSMVSLMLLLQIPLAALSGWLVDRGHGIKVMFLGLSGLSLAMGCWVMATWFGVGWIWAAYIIWGLFGLVNVAQPSLALKLSPRDDNALQLSLFRQMGGLLAAISGLIGGAILSGFSEGTSLAPIAVFQALFVVSGVGRALAAIWFLPLTSHMRDAEAAEYLP